MGTIVTQSVLTVSIQDANIPTTTRPVTLLQITIAEDLRSIENLTFPNKVDFTDSILVSDVLFAPYIRKSRALSSPPAPDDDPVGVLPTSARVRLANDSRYNSTKVFPSLASSFGQWSLLPNSIPEDPSDSYHTVKTSEEFRLDLISFKHYTTARYWWVIALANNIMNPFVAPSVDDILRIPSYDRVKSTLLLP